MANKRIKKASKRLGEKAVEILLTKAAAPAVPAPDYRYVWERGPEFDDDPGVRERAWRETHRRFLGKSRSASGGITPGQLLAWEEGARFDPDPGVREALWAAIAEATEATR